MLNDVCLGTVASLLAAREWIDEGSLDDAVVTVLRSVLTDGEGDDERRSVEGRAQPRAGRDRQLDVSGNGAGERTTNGRAWPARRKGGEDGLVVGGELLASCWLSLEGGAGLERDRSSEDRWAGDRRRRREKVMLHQAGCALGRVKEGGGQQPASGRRASRPGSAVAGGSSTGRKGQARGPGGGRRRSERAGRGRRREGEHVELGRRRRRAAASRPPLNAQP